MDNVILSKATTVERCLLRIREEYDNNPMNLRENLTVQDSILLNLERCAQAVIDMASHLVKIKKLGVSQNYRGLFELLYQEKIIEEDLKIALQNMVGFRNIAIHEYQRLDMTIVESIIINELSKIEKFKRMALQLPYD